MFEIKFVGWFRDNPAQHPAVNSLEFKQLLLQDMDRFALAFVEQLATFALRRAMTVDDMDQIKSIALSSKKDDYKLKSVIENLVVSDLFQKR